MRLKRHSNQEWIQIEGKHFAGGGEGNLFHINSPSNLHRRYIAKLYHPHKLNKDRQDKLHFLYEHPPNELTDGRRSPSIIWAEDLLYDEHGKLVGLLMPFMPGEKLEILSTLKIPKKKRGRFQRFSLQREGALKLRMRLCFNIAVALQQVHSTGSYILVDLKPDNVVIQPNGLISLVDMDSVEVIKDGKTLYDAPVATPEYTPPEHYLKLDYDPTAVLDWDHFSMAVIFYKLLFGIHPYAAGNLPPYDQCLTLEQKIEAGLFVHAKSKKKYINILPPPHKAFEELPESLQVLFMRAFEEGHQQTAARPTAEEWCIELLKAINDPKLNEVFGHLLLPTAPAQIKVQRRLPSERLKSPDYQKEDAKRILPQPLYNLDNIQGQALNTSPPTVSSYVEFPKKAPNFGNCLTTIFIGGIALSVFSGIFEIDFFFDMFGIFFDFLGEMMEDAFRLFGIDDDFIVFAIIALIILFFVGGRRLYQYLRFLISEQFRNKLKLGREFKKGRKRFEELLTKAREYQQSLKNVNEEPIVDSIYEQNQGHIENFRQRLQELDPEVIQLKEEEKLAYEQLHDDYLAKAKNHPMLADLEGETLADLRKNLLENRVESEAWLRAKTALEELLEDYKNAYQEVKKSFNEKYEEIIQQAESALEETKSKIEEEEEKQKAAIASEFEDKISLAELENFEKDLRKQKVQLEVLNKVKESYKKINFKEYRKKK